MFAGGGEIDLSRPMTSTPDTWLLIATAITSLIAAATGLLNLRRRYDLPVIIAKATDTDLPDLNITGRHVAFRQPTSPSPWLVSAITLAGPRGEWLCRSGDGVNNNFGEFVGYRIADNWTKRIVFQPPLAGGELLVHPDAPAHLELRFTVVLRARPRVKQTIPVHSE